MYHACQETLINGICTAFQTWVDSVSIESEALIHTPFVIAIVVVFGVQSQTEQVSTN